MFTSLMLKKKIYLFSLLTLCLKTLEPVFLRPALLKSPVCSDWSALTGLRRDYLPCDCTKFQNTGCVHFCVDLAFVYLDSVCVAPTPAL